MYGPNRSSSIRSKWWKLGRKVTYLDLAELRVLPRAGERDPHEPVPLKIKEINHKEINYNRTQEGCRSARCGEGHCPEQAIHHGCEQREGRNKPVS